MATIKLNKTYRCSDDCEQGGCPSHESKLEYMSVTDGYTFVGRNTYHFERGELETLIKLLLELGEIRADGVSIKRLVQEAVKGKCLT
jgi:hypothetical protein